MNILTLVRPFAIAFGLAMVASAGASTAAPGFGAARLLVNLPVPEPYLSYALLPLAACLLFPARVRIPRAAQFLVLSAFACTIIADVIGYYVLIGEGRITTPLPVPFSAVLLAIVAAQALGVLFECRLARTPWQAQTALTVCAYLLLMVAHVMSFGLTDYRCSGNADVAIVLGARVDADRTVCPALARRLETGIELYREKRVKRLIMTGGTGESGVNEADAMAEFACARGVPARDVLLDPDGVTTYQSAVNCAALLRRDGYTTAMLVSQYYHLARTKLIFERRGVQVRTVPAGTGVKMPAHLYNLLREAAALPYYYLCGT
jgi:vancomycin permeability regulator SanA